MVVFLRQESVSLFLVVSLLLVGGGGFVAGGSSIAVDVAAGFGGVLTEEVVVTM